MAERKFLDTAGVSRLWDNIVEKIVSDVNAEKTRAVKEEVRLEEKIEGTSLKFQNYYSKEESDEQFVSKTVAEENYAKSSYVGVIPEEYAEYSVIGYIDKITKDAIAQAKNDSDASIAVLQEFLNQHIQDSSSRFDSIDEELGVLDTLSQSYVSLQEIVVNNTKNISEVFAVLDNYSETTEEITKQVSQLTERTGKLEEGQKLITDLAIVVEENGREIANNKESISTIQQKIGDVPEGKTVVQLINDIAVGGIEYDDTEIRELITSETKRAEKVEQDLLQTILEIENNIGDIVTDYVTEEFKNISLATTEQAGLVKTSNEIGVDQNGRMLVYEISTDKLVQGEKELILNGGDLE